MNKLVFSILCGSVSEDLSSKTISLINLVEAINVELPEDLKGKAVNITYPSSLVTRWEKGECGDTLQRVYMVYPSGEDGAPIDLPIKFQGKSHARVVVSSGGLVIKGQGRYKMKIQQQVKDEWVDSGEADFDVFVRYVTPL